MMSRFWVNWVKWEPYYDGLDNAILLKLLFIVDWTSYTTHQSIVDNFDVEEVWGNTDDLH
jgi:hypothetical protein